MNRRDGVLLTQDPTAHCDEIVQDTEGLDEDDPSHGWFLHQVTVTDSSGQEWPFPCNSWIGDSDADGYEGTSPGLHLRILSRSFQVPNSFRSLTLLPA